MSATRERAGYRFRYPRARRNLASVMPVKCHHENECGEAYRAYDVSAAVGLFRAMADASRHCA